MLRLENGAVGIVGVGIVMIAPWGKGTLEFVFFAGSDG